MVGPVEADPLAGKISNESPIGKELMGKKVGDEFKAQNSVILQAKILQNYEKTNEKGKIYPALSGSTPR